MNEILSNGTSQTLVLLSMDNLREIMHDCFLKAKEELSQAQDTTQELLTTNEVCKILHVDKSTLWRWGNTGYLVPKKVGSKNMYNKKDIDKIQK